MSRPLDAIMITLDLEEERVFDRVWVVDDARCVDGIHHCSYELESVLSQDSLDLLTVVVQQFYAFCSTELSIRM